MSTSIVNANGASINALIGRTLIAQALQGDLSAMGKLKTGELYWRLSTPQKAAVINSIDFSLAPTADENFVMYFDDLALVVDDRIPPDQIQLRDKTNEATFGVIMNLAVPSVG